ncbi:MAG: CAP domain-containing protein [Deltaproteobacteria bacterium]|nr:CAP domain-containing protein [Deltaproteobacteria bacterium]
MTTVEKVSSKPAGGAVQAKLERAEPSVEVLSKEWKRGIIDTASGAEYLERKEKEVITEINMVRTDPVSYVKHYLEPLRLYYHDRLLQYPGAGAISTSEGIRALEECIRDIKRAKPVRPLSPKRGLTFAARDQAKDQAGTGAFGHAGSDGSSVTTRLTRYGRWNISAGENIYYGNGDARRIVTALLVDDGIPSRGHRNNLLDTDFNFVGVAVGPHREYGNMCVMDFAGSYE